MGELVQFESGTGASIIVEVGVSEGVGRVSRPGEIAGRAAKTLEEALDVVRPTSDALYRAFQELDVQPEAVTVSFGVRLTVKAGAIIAESQGEAHFEVSLTWNKK